MTIQEYYKDEGGLTNVAWDDVLDGLPGYVKYNAEEARAAVYEAAGIREITKPGESDTFEVKSSTKDVTYIVQYKGSGDGDPDFISLWECSCPAGQHGKNCKHMRKVSAVVDYLYY